MKCRDAVEMINSYFDNNIDPMNDKLLAEHIRSCPKCRAELHFLIEYRKLLKTVKPASPPDNFLSEIHRKIERDKAENPVKKIIDSARYYLSIFNFPLEAAGVLAVATLVFFLYKPFFNDKIQMPLNEYGIETTRSEMPVKKDIPSSADKPDRSIIVKNFADKETEAPSVKEVMKEKSSEEFAADDNLSIRSEKDYDSAEINEMKKSRSVASEKSMMKREEKAPSVESMDAKGAVSQLKDQPGSPDYNVEKLFIELDVSIIKKDISLSSGLYYRVKVSPLKHASLIKRLKENYSVEEKILKDRKTYQEIELFLKKKKN